MKIIISNIKEVMVEAGKRKAPIRKMNIMIIGDSSVGKTALLNMYTKDKFMKTAPSVGIDSFITRYKTPDDHDYKVTLWDSAGQENFQSITKGFYKNADGICIMYDITNDKTFNSVVNWIGSITQ